VRLSPVAGQEYGGPQFSDHGLREGEGWGKVG
jgi:hypothetical protein